jgi:hypothetical protein
MLPCMPGRAAAEPPTLVIEAPAAFESREILPLLEVRGFAGAGAGRPWDLVIVLDLSESTLHSAGLDLDQDGPTGGTDPWLLAVALARKSERPGLHRELSAQDFDDTILAAELEAAEALIARLPAVRFRVGVVAFSDEARVVSPLGPPTEVAGRIAELRRDFPGYLRGTNFAAAIEAAHELLDPPGSPAGDPGVGRAIVFLTDGVPTLPVHGDRAELAALEAAREVGMANIRLFAFPLGPEAEAVGGLLQRMVEWSEGEVHPIAHPARTVVALRALRLVDLLDVTVHNATNGASARGLRVFPDGSFDALVPLQPGRNRVRIEAYSSEGDGVAGERIVFRDLAEQSASDRERGARLLEALRLRTRELELWAEVERQRRNRPQRLQLEIGAFPQGAALPTRREAPDPLEASDPPEASDQGEAPDQGNPRTEPDPS